MPSVSHGRASWVLGRHVTASIGYLRRKLVRCLLYVRDEDEAISHIRLCSAPKSWVLKVACLFCTYLGPCNLADARTRICDKYSHRSDPDERAVSTRTQNSSRNTYSSREIQVKARHEDLCVSSTAVRCVC